MANHAIHLNECTISIVMIGGLHYFNPASLPTGRMRAAGLALTERSRGLALSNCPPSDPKPNKDKNRQWPKGFAH